MQVREYVTFPVRRMPRTTRLIAGTGVFGVVIGTGLLPVPCLFLLLTGLDCPFCGGSRAAGALLHLDVATALDHNAFAVLVVLPLVIAVLVGMVREELGYAAGFWPAGPTGTVLGYALLVAVVSWGVVRNLPFPPFEVLRA